MPLRDYWNRALAEYDRPGPEVVVSPFRPGEVTGEGIALKSLASLIAGRRAATAAKLKRTADEQDIRYRALLSKKLEADLNEPQYDVDVEGVGRVKLTGPQAATYSSAAAGRKAAQERHDATQAAVLDRFDRAQKGIQDRFNTTQENRLKRTTASKNYTAAQAALKNLDAEVEREGEQNALAAQAHIDKMLQRLSSPNYSPAVKADAAAALGIPPATDDRGKPLYVPGTKNPVYDVTGPDTRAAIAKLLERAKARGISRRSAMQRARRAALERVSVQEAGVLNEMTNDAAGANDPIMRGIMELRRLYFPEVTEDDPSLDLQSIPDDQPILN